MKKSFLILVLLGYYGNAQMANIDELSFNESELNGIHLPLDVQDFENDRSEYEFELNVLKSNIEVALIPSSFANKSFKTDGLPSVDPKLELKAKGFESSKDLLEKEYYKNKNIIKARWGYVDVEKVNRRVWFLNEETINSRWSCIIDLLKNRFSRLRVEGDCSNGGDIFLNNSPIISSDKKFVYDIDGNLSSVPPYWLFANQIRRVAVFPSPTIASKYGFFNGAGVIVVNTYEGTKVNKEITDILEIPSSKNRIENQSNRLFTTVVKKLKATSDLNLSKKIIEDFEEEIEFDPEQLFAIYDYFIQEHGEKKYARNLVKKHTTHFKFNYELTSVIAYQFESRGEFDLAKEWYKTAFILNPNRAENYLNWGRSALNLGDHITAASIFQRYLHLTDRGYFKEDGNGLKSLIEREYNNIQNLYLRDRSRFSIHTPKTKDTRLVFESSSRNQNYEILFFNNRNEMLTVKNEFDAYDQINQNQNMVFFPIKEYFIDSSSMQELNVKSRAIGKSKEPIFLKVTVFKDYGLPTQQQDVAVFKCDSLNPVQNLFTLQFNEKVKNSETKYLIAK